MKNNFEKIQYYYESFLKLPIQYKILVSILVSLLIHLSFSLLFYIGLYHYASEYGINYQSIDTINITLLALPFYFDVLLSLFIMISLTIVIIFFLVIFEFKFKKKPKKNYNFSFLYKKMYRSIKKDDSIRLSNKHIILFINTILAIMVLLIFMVILIVLKFNISFILFTKIFIPVLVALYVVVFINRITFRSILIILIFFIIITSFNSLRMNGIKEYLIKNNMGGEIPLSLNIQNKFIDGFLVLLTNEKVYFLNRERNVLTSIDRKNVFKMNYFLKKISKFDDNSSLSIPATGDTGLRSFTIAGEYPFKNDDTLDFSKLHY